MLSCNPCNQNLSEKTKIDDNDKFLIKSNTTTDFTDTLDPENWSLHSNNGVARFIGSRALILSNTLNQSSVCNRTQTACDSVKDAVEKNNYSSNCEIIKCCKNNGNTYKGFKWKYLDNDVINRENTKKNNEEIYVNIDDIYGTKYNNYKISNYGKLYNIKKKFCYKMSASSGYYKCTLIDIDGNKNDYSIHRLVAYFFISKEKCEKVVNHKDENKLNNYYKNLEWMNDKKENTTYSTGKRVCQIDKNTNQIIKTFNSINSALTELKISKNGIQKCIKGKQKSSGGFIWKLEV